MSEGPRYTLDDLADAERALARVLAASDNYSGNNPDKYESDLKAARRHVDYVTSMLKHQGTLAWTDEERVTRILDAMFPKARSKQIVAHEGKRYQLRFTPIEWSRSRKTVTRWDRAWIELGG